MDTGETTLVALRWPPGPGFVRELERLWDEGAAVLPLRPDLPDPATRRLLDGARPGSIVEPAGTTALRGARPARGALCLATAGSTGAPKLVELSRAALETSARLTADRLECEGARWLCCLPLDHVAGIMTIVRSRLYGADPVIVERFDPAEVAATDADAISLVPTMLERLLERGVDVSRWRWLLLGGQAVPPALLERAPGAIRTYGMTETCGGVVYDGRPLRGVDVRIGDDGIVLLRTPTIMAGYRGGPSFGGGWFATGDLGEWDGSRLRVVGRADDVIVTGGENVSPEEVEGLLSSHPSVGDVAVAGRSDARWGERVVAFVVPAGPAPSLEDLRAHVKARAAAYKAPRELVLVDELPRLPSGKIARASLSSVS